MEEEVVYVQRNGCAEVDKTFGFVIAFRNGMSMVLYACVERGECKLQNLVVFLIIYSKIV